ncbi:DUF1016 N-terminal domain-containing protein [Rickettsia endosymbiont of Pantilius tunicatus]|uniref:DUF1016 N-terminal domain-containing protein n=1 Tax=Rickettsia endosymbiont of Pantilius tunicatus TaxID=3066267 RepID=UPI00376EEB48
MLTYYLYAPQAHRLFDFQILKYLRYTGIEILKSIRAEYGQEVIKTLAKGLSSLYRQGFSRIALILMNQFYQSFKEQQISATLSHQLSWSHIIELLPPKEHNQREFYAYMSIQENWNVRKLRSNIDKMLYERTKLSNRSEEQVISLFKTDSRLEPNLILKDPYILDELKKLATSS